MIDKAPEERERGITINTAHVEYETDAPHYATLTARTCRLYQEHDYRRGADGRRDPCHCSFRRTDGPDARAHSAGPPGRRSCHCCLPDKVRSGRRPRTARACRDGVRELLTQYDFPETIFRSSRAARCRLSNLPPRIRTPQSIRASRNCWTLSTATFRHRSARPTCRSYACGRSSQSLAAERSPRAVLSVARSR